MIRVAVCQMTVSQKVNDNITKMLELIEQATAQRSGLDVIVFPEYCYGSPPTASPMPAYGEHTERIAEAARKKHVNILAGSFMKTEDSGKYSNMIYFYNRQGEIILEYSKTHLMQGMGFDEAKFVVAGNKSGLIKTDFGTIGVIVCYELRFPEIARSLVLEGAEMIFCPAEFPVGKVLPPRTDHWDILVKATALQNLTWTVAANNYGTSPSGENPFGRSMVVDPWGTVVTQCRTCEDICYGEIDLDYQKSIRESIGGLQNRRPELYKL